MNGWKLTEAEHAARLEAVPRKHPDTVAVLVFGERFCGRLVLVQRPLFAKFVRPACWKRLSRLSAIGPAPC